jgi:DNA protecting protein DprA
MRAAYKIAYEVAAAGAIIVSGMALGIDSVAASAALRAKGKTVAVLGSGIDIVYPKEHVKLYRAIAENGVVLSEYPPSSDPRSFNFPKRNRIISGLSQGTVVIDAGEGSGALITSKTAILQGRDVYAVPSNIDSENSSGTNSLIRDGAQAVLCGYDIIKNYAYLFRDTINVQNLRMAEERSQLDLSALIYYGVRAKGRIPAFEGISARAEREQKKTENAPRVPAARTVEEKKKSKPEPTGEQNATNKTGDNSREIFESLGETEQKIFSEMPLDTAVSADYFTKTGYKFSDIMSALTRLEIKGLVASLPGGLYTRK